MKIQLKACVRCERIFASLKSEVCAACEPAEEADFTRIRNTLRESPGLNVEQVSEAAQVSTACVLRMLSQGRIENTSLGNPIRCGHCGAPALSVSKRLCQNCLKRLDQQYAEAIRDVRGRIREKRAVEPPAHTVRKAVDDKRQFMDGKNSSVARKRSKRMEPDLPR